MKLEDHLKNTKGEGEEIHKFMDQYWDEFQEDHHIILHHRKGIEYICNKFGNNSKWIVMQHLKDDGYDGIQRQIRNNHNDPLFKDWTDKFEDAKIFANNLFLNSG